MLLLRVCLHGCVCVCHHRKKLTDNVHDYILSLNFGYKKALREKSVTYINAYAAFVDPHTVQYTLNAGKPTAKVMATAKTFLIAVGGRPKYPSEQETPGAREFGITSDDIFTLDHPPGKTLCAGAGYIALECAGFLAELGFDTTVMVRSLLLRGFDRECVGKIETSLVDAGVHFHRDSVMSRVERDAESGKLKVRAARPWNLILYVGRHACGFRLGRVILEMARLSLCVILHAASSSSAFAVHVVAPR